MSFKDLPTEERQRYCAAVLAAELAKPDYDGKTADEAWAWLTVPVTPEAVKSPSGLLLTPLVVSRILGPMKAEAMAGAMKATFPNIASYLLEHGVDPLNTDAAKFIGGLIVGSVLTQEDATKLNDAAYTTTQPASFVRFDQRFFPQLWPHVAQDGTIGKDSDPAIHGFPNTIDREDFDAAWAAAGRKQ